MCVSSYGSKVDAVEQRYSEFHRSPQPGILVPEGAAARGKSAGGAEGRFSLRKRSAERPWNFLNRDISPSPSVLSWSKGLR